MHEPKIHQYPQRCKVIIALLSDTNVVHCPGNFTLVSANIFIMCALTANIFVHQSLFASCIILEPLGTILIHQPAKINPTSTLILKITSFSM
jgi:hypothetical protein